MTLATPIALFALLMLPLAVWLARRARPRVFMTGAGAIWQRVAASAPARRRISQRDRALLIRLLAATLIILAAARPQWTGQTAHHLVIGIDLTPTLATETKSGGSRLDALKASAFALLDRDPAPLDVEIVTAPIGARVHSLAEARAAIAELHAPVAPFGATAASNLSTVLRDRAARGREVWYFGDREPIDRAALVDAGVGVKISAPSAVNAGIVDALLSPSDSGWRLSATVVTNASETPALRVTHESSEQIVPLIAFERAPTGRAFRAHLELAGNAGTLVELALTSTDAFAGDDRARLSARPSFRAIAHAPGALTAALVALGYASASAEGQVGFVLVDREQAAAAGDVPRIILARGRGALEVDGVVMVATSAREFAAPELGGARIATTAHPSSARAEDVLLQVGETPLLVGKKGEVEFLFDVEQAPGFLRDPGGAFVLTVALAARVCMGVTEDSVAPATANLLSLATTLDACGGVEFTMPARPTDLVADQKPPSSLSWAPLLVALILLVGAPPKPTTR